MRRSRTTAIDKRKRRSQLISIAIIAGVVAGIAYGVYSYAQNPPRTANFGALGSTHEHTAFKLFINGQTIDFSQPKYQVKSQYVHLENGDGDTIHKHATGIDIGFLFETLSIKFTSECIIMDDGTDYCNDGNNTVKFFVNGIRNNMYNNYVLMDDDRILLSYGPESQEQIDEQLKAVEILSVNV
ncbi:MAG: hypothetical protein ACRD5H_05035 [Nitrososphaerales archaeon]